MKYVYLIVASYRSPNLQKQGSYQNICFETEKEAKDFCDYHGTDLEFFSWQRVLVGKFKKPRKKK